MRSSYIKLYLGTGIRLFVGIALILFGIASYLLFYPYILQKLIEGRVLVLSPESAFFKSWSSSEHYMITEIYLFEVLNPKEFLSGKKPKLAEHGPFAFRYKTVRERLTWLDNGTKLSYYERHLFYFDRERSVAGLEDFKLTVVNLPFAAVLNKAKSFDIIMKPLLSTYGERLLERRTPLQILAGRPVELLDSLRSIAEPLSALLTPIKKILDNLPKQVGYLYQRNNTLRGPIVIHTGLRTSADVVREFDLYSRYRFLVDILYWMVGADPPVTTTEPSSTSTTPKIERRHKREVVTQKPKERKRLTRQERRELRRRQRRKEEATTARARANRAKRKTQTWKGIYEPLNRQVLEFDVVDGKKYLNNYDKPGCYRPFGSDGTGFDNFRVQSQQQLYLYMMICRTAKLVYHESDRVSIVPINRYLFDHNTFSMSDQSNWCYCKDALYRSATNNRRFPRDLGAIQTQSDSDLTREKRDTSDSVSPCDLSPSTADSRRECRQWRTEQYLKSVKGVDRSTPSSLLPGTVRPRFSNQSALPANVPKSGQPRRNLTVSVRNGLELSSSRPTRCDGYHDMDVCANGAPISVSFPHFLDTPKLQALVEGLNPNPDKHRTYFDISPTLGVTINAKVRLQINIRLSRRFYSSSRDHFQPSLMPYLWFVEGGTADSKQIKKLCLATVVFNIGYFLCILISLIGLWMIYRVVRRFVSMFNHKMDGDPLAVKQNRNKKLDSRPAFRKSKTNKVCDKNLKKFRKKFEQTKTILVNHTTNNNKKNKKSTTRFKPETRQSISQKLKFCANQSPPQNTTTVPWNRLNSADSVPSVKDVTPEFPILESTSPVSIISSPTASISSSNSVKNREIQSNNIKSKIIAKGLEFNQEIRNHGKPLGAGGAGRPIQKFNSIDSMVEPADNRTKDDKEDEDFVDTNRIQWNSSLSINNVNELHRRCLLKNNSNYSGAVSGPSGVNVGSGLSSFSKNQESLERRYPSRFLDNFVNDTNTGRDRFDKNDKCPSMPPLD